MYLFLRPASGLWSSSLCHSLVRQIFIDHWYPPQVSFQYKFSFFPTFLRPCWYVARPMCKAYQQVARMLLVRHPHWPCFIPTTAGFKIAPLLVCGTAHVQSIPTSCPHVVGTPPALALLHTNNSGVQNCALVGMWRGPCAKHTNKLPACCWYATRIGPASYQQRRASKLRPCWYVARPMCKAYQQVARMLLVRHPHWPCFIPTTAVVVSLPCTPNLY